MARYGELHIWLQLQLFLLAGSDGSAVCAYAQVAEMNLHIHTEFILLNVVIIDLSDFILPYILIKPKSTFLCR